jgi:hypothetical protein
LFDQSFFASVNPNSQFNAVTTLKGGFGCALDVNNGIRAFSYGYAPASAVTITGISYAPGNVTITWNNVLSGYSYQLQSATSLSARNWSNVGSPVTTTNVSASTTDTSVATTAKFYRVTAH